jgi:hypothetical protein
MRRDRGQYHPDKAIRRRLVPALGGFSWDGLHLAKCQCPTPRNNKPCGCGQFRAEQELERARQKRDQFIVDSMAPSLRGQEEPETQKWADSMLRLTSARSVEVMIRAAYPDGQVAVYAVLAGTPRGEESPEESVGNTLSCPPSAEEVQ